MNHDTATGTHRRDLLKGAAGIAVGAAAATMLPGGLASAAQAKSGMSLTLEGVGTFQVLAYSWGASQSGTTHQGGGGGAGTANFQDLAVTKYLDGTSPLLLQHVATGAIIPTAELTVATKAGPVVSFSLAVILVTSLSTGGSEGEDMLTENLSLNFREFTYTVGDTEFGWDIADGSAP